MAADIIKSNFKACAGLRSLRPRADGSSIWRQRKGAALPPADRLRYQTKFGSQPAASERQHYQVLDLTKPDWKTNVWNA